MWAESRHARTGGRLAAALLLVAVAGCTRIENSMAKISFLDFMHSSPAFDPYEATRPAPPGAVPYQSPVGTVLPPIEASAQALDAFAQGPYAHNPVPMTDSAALAHGKVMYDRYCMVCHGPLGHADGPAVGPGKFPTIVPKLSEGSAVQRADGYIYGIIRVGRGLMPAYGSRTTHMERWDIVNYVRTLQQQAAGEAAPGGGAAGAATTAGQGRD